MCSIKECWKWICFILAEGCRTEYTTLYLSQVISLSCFESLHLALLCVYVSPPAAGVGVWARPVEPPAGLGGGSGRGDRSHRLLSEPDLPHQLPCVGSRQGALQGLPEGLGRKGNCLRCRFYIISRERDKTCSTGKLLLIYTRRYLSSRTNSTPERCTGSCIYDIILTP